MKKNMGSTIAMVLGVLVLITGLTQPNASYINSGFIMLIGAFAYRSAKKRALGEVGNTAVRKITELAGVAIIFLLMALQRDLTYWMVEDPVPNLIIPLWAVVAYVIASLKKQPTDLSSN